MKQINWFYSVGVVITTLLLLSAPGGNGKNCSCTGGDEITVTWEGNLPCQETLVYTNGNQNNIDIDWINEGTSVYVSTNINCSESCGCDPEFEWTVSPYTGSDMNGTGLPIVITPDPSGNAPWIYKVTIKSYCGKKKCRDRKVTIYIDKMESINSTDHEVNLDLEKILVSSDCCNFTYNLTVSNSGLLTATGIQVTDFPPDTTLYQYPVIPQNTSYHDFVWNIPVLSPGESFTLGLTLVLEDGCHTCQDIVNCAEITRVDQTNTSNSTRACAVIPGECGPCSARIAYETIGTGGDTEIYSVDPDNPDLPIHHTSDDSGEDQMVAWSPNGRMLAYCSSEWIDYQAWGFEMGDLGWIDALYPNSAEHIIFNETDYSGRGFQSPSWSPDGSRMAFSWRSPGNTIPSNFEDIYVADLTYDNNNEYITDVGTPIFIASTGPRAIDIRPTWSPDGSKLAFASNATGAWALYMVDLTPLDPSSPLSPSNPPSQMARLTDWQYDDRDPSWSPVEDKIVFSSYRDNNWDIYELDVSGFDFSTPLSASSATRLTDDGGIDRQPAWSPDGSRIAFVSNRGQNDPNNYEAFEIYVMDHEGENEHVVTSNNAYTGWPAWSPCDYTSEPPSDDCVYWARTYGGLWNDAGYSVAQTPDGGFIAAGDTGSAYSSSNSSIPNDYWVVKTDASGNVEWQKRYGGSGYDYGRSIQPTDDGGYIVAGHTYSFGAGSGDVWIIKLDSFGEVEWQHTYGGTRFDAVNSVVQTDDGGYISVGTTNSSSAGGRDVLALKLNAYGNIEGGWPKTFGGAGDECAYQVRQTSDEGYIIAGYKATGDTTDAWVIKLSDTGEMEWNTVTGGLLNDAVYAVREIPAGGYILSGNTQLSGNASPQVFWVFRLDATGNVLWQNVYNNPGTSDEYATAIDINENGEYFVTGYTYDSANESRKIWVLKLASNGDILEQKLYDHNEFTRDEAWEIQAIDDDGCIIAGFVRRDDGIVRSDMWLLRLDSYLSITNPACELAHDTWAITENITYGWEHPDVPMHMCFITDSPPMYTDTTLATTDTQCCGAGGGGNGPCFCGQWSPITVVYQTADNQSGNWTGQCGQILPTEYAVTGIYFSSTGLECLNCSCTEPEYSWKVWRINDVVASGSGLSGYYSTPPDAWDHLTVEFQAMCFDVPCWCSFSYNYYQNNY
ncbi:MAG: PD40 domain-containing protein [Dehalococcoidales bacterium]|nr:PD40 domain-containing protein [Dehalococcoidales bacterium]